jgi:hypothetical protein
VQFEFSDMHIENVEEIKRKQKFGTIEVSFYGHLELGLQSYGEGCFDYNIAKVKI